MSSFIQQLYENQGLSLEEALAKSRHRIIDRYEQQKDREQLKREILAECEKMIEQRINFQIQNDALPALKELDRTLKNLGNL